MKEVDDDEEEDLLPPTPPGGRGTCMVPNEDRKKMKRDKEGKRRGRRDRLNRKRSVAKQRSAA